MTPKNSWHENLLMTTAIGISCVTIYSAIAPEMGNRNLASFTFPEEIPIPSWKSINSEEIVLNAKQDEDTSEFEDTIHSGNRYQYQHKDTQLEIEIYYLTNTRGNLKNLLLKQANIAPEALEKTQNKQLHNSYYSTFKSSDRSYLSSCLHATGDATVNHKQFSHILNQKQINWQVLSNWFLGKDSIRDRRCLWITISTPNNIDSLIQPNEILEQTWHNLYQWWQPRFPQI